jgi:hypothetical protein
VKLDLDRATLPADAEDKGYQEVVVQELWIFTENVRFLPCIQGLQIPYGP